MGAHAYHPVVLVENDKTLAGCKMLWHRHCYNVTRWLGAVVIVIVEGEVACVVVGVAKAEQEG